MKVARPKEFFCWNCYHDATLSARFAYAGISHCLGLLVGLCISHGGPQSCSLLFCFPYQLNSQRGWVWEHPLCLLLKSLCRTICIQRAAKNLAQESTVLTQVFCGQEIGFFLSGITGMWSCIQDFCVCKLLLLVTCSCVGLSCRGYADRLFRKSLTNLSAGIVAMGGKLCNGQEDGCSSSSSVVLCSLEKI